MVQSFGFMRYFTFLFRIDRRIYWSFGGLLLLSIIIFLFQYFRRVDCESARFVVFGDEMMPGRVIEFYDNTPNAQSWEWDFGDGSKPDYNQRALHTYQKSGNYIIRLKINGHCTHEKSIVISNDNKNIGYLPRIIAPSVVTVGQIIHFEGEKEGGKSWEWSFGETATTDALGQSVSYQFKSVGEKKITLIVNGDVEHPAVKTIYVAPKTIKAKQKIDIKSYEFEKSHASFSLPKGDPQKDPLVDMLQHIPVAPKSATPKDSIIPLPKAPEISNEQFQLLLHQVAHQAKTKDDFKDYLCGQYAIPMVVNDKDLLPFDEFCKRIAGKKIKISAIRLHKNEQNCIENINIHYKTKKWGLWMKE